MGIFESSADKLKREQFHEALYAQAASEINSGIASPGLMARAFAESGGDECKARARYIELRVEALKLEANALVEQREIENRRQRQSEKEAIARAQAHAEQQRIQEEKRIDEQRRAEPIGIIGKLFLIGWGSGFVLFIFLKHKLVGVSYSATSSELVKFLIGGSILGIMIGIVLVIVGSAVFDKK